MCNNDVILMIIITYESFVFLELWPLFAYLTYLFYNHGQFKWECLPSKCYLFFS